MATINLVLRERLDNKGQAALRIVIRNKGKALLYIMTLWRIIKHCDQESILLQISYFKKVKKYY